MIRTLALALTLSVSAPALAHSAPDGFTELTERLSPAVVNISTAQTVEIGGNIPQYEEGSPLERFNDFFGGGRDDDRVSKSLGSGFVIDPAGFIVTNNHVIEDADLIEVTFPNGDTYQAELIGRDAPTDLAVLKIEDPEPFPFVNFGDSDTAKVGEWVVAIGNPFGYAGSVAAGIVSARNRNIGSSAYDDFIQTDVAINRGNSGGPLFDMDGNVVGVNTAILSPTGYSVGISFAIPADLAEQVTGQLREFGETRRGTLGVRILEVDRALAESYGLDSPKGALVRQVLEDSPADAAGIKRGDLILSLDGEDLDDTRDLYRAIAQAPIGRTVEIGIIRKRKPMTLRAEIERLEPKTKDQVLRDEDAKENADRVAGGISVEALTDDVRRANRVDEDVNGVRVVFVDRRSPSTGKVLPGDIIEQIDFEDIATPEDFAKAMEKAGDLDRAVQVLLNRGGNYVFYAVRVG